MYDLAIAVAERADTRPSRVRGALALLPHLGERHLKP